jgi:hypothetical protein
MKYLTPDSGVPITPEIHEVDLRERVDACVSTLEYLSNIDPTVLEDIDLEVTQADIEIANEIVAAFAQDPVLTSQTVSAKAISALQPRTMIAVKAILDEFGHSVVQSATLIRHLVVNKLIIETENLDPRIRMRALENLGKMSDVALFTERSEVTITHQSTDDLKSKLKAKLDAIRERATTLSQNSEGVYEISTPQAAKRAIDMSAAEQELSL